MPQLTSQEFRDCLQTRFAMDAASGGTVPLELVEVSEGNYSPRLECFSLIFRGPLSPFYPQCIYRLSHEKLGEMELFLVPVGPDSSGMRYEAVFNRLRDGAR